MGEFRLLKRHHDNALANISGNAVPAPIGLRRLVFERLRPAGSVPIIPAIKRRWLDTEHLKRLPGRQMRLLDEADDLKLRDAGVSCLVSPIPDHAFFEQPQFERLLGDNLLQVLIAPGYAELTISSVGRAEADGLISC